MIIKTIELETVCGVTSRLPANNRPEFAFAGKSNVGKSSLINTLCNRKSYARTSSQPGKTQTINFYRINKDFYFVDLPGYGYAKVAKSEREKWGPMIDRYLHTSGQLRAVFLLVDLRHAPSENDKNMYQWILANGLTPVVIATKADKLKRSQIGKQMALVRRELRMRPEEKLIVFSAQTRQGKEELLSLMESLLQPETPPDAPKPEEESPLN